MGNGKWEKERQTDLSMLSSGACLCNCPLKYLLLGWASPLGHLSTYMLSSLLKPYKSPQSVVMLICR